MIRVLREDEVMGLATRLAGLALLQRYGRTPDSIARDLVAALARGDGVLGYVEDGEGAGEVVGLAWFQRTAAFGFGGYLKLLAVVPGCEARGVGAALLRGFEEQLAPETPHAFLLVSDFNADAARFYARHGYARVGALPGLVLSDVDEILFYKRLR